MVLNFANPGLDYCVDSIMLFQRGETPSSDFWRAALFDAYPQLDRTVFDALPDAQRSCYLKDKLCADYLSADLTAKAAQYDAHWQKHRSEVVHALSDAFGVDCHNNFCDIVGNVTLNPICPRFLDRHTFDVFHMYSERGALGVAIHEIIHFIWFDVWQRHFRDDVSEYDTPHLKWVLSEAVIDTITRNDPRLSEKYPFTDYAYPYLYDIVIDGAPLLERLNAMYNGASITDFMEEGYRLFATHENVIRQHMR